MFKDQEVGNKYTTQLHADQVVHMPRYADKRPFRKKISDLSIAEADALYNHPDKNNFLQLKQPAAPAKQQVPPAEKK